MPFRIIVAGLLSALALAAQVADPAPDPDVYLGFFRSAANRVGETVIHPGYLNGKPVEQVVFPSVQDSIGITAAQSQSLMHLAALCEVEVDALETSSHAMVFESRLQAAQDDKHSDDVEAKLKAIEAKRIAIILGYVQKIRTSLGAEAFWKVGDYIRDHAATGYFAATAPQKL